MPSSEFITRATDATGASPSAATREAINVANAAFMAAFRAADAGAVADCYTTEAQLLPANSDVISGRDAIATFWGGVMKMGIADVRLETASVESQGDLGVEVGRYVLAGADGGAVDNGKYVVVWHREGGSWKLHRDIWTTSRPTAGA